MIIYVKRVSSNVGENTFCKNSPAFIAKGNNKDYMKEDKKEQYIIAWRKWESDIRYFFINE